MWIRKKDTFIPLCSKLKSYRELSSLQVIMAFILASLFLAGGFSCGRQEATETATLKNSPPRIVSVRILPENPHRESIFNLVIESYDPDHDRVGYRYQWLKNGEEMNEENKEILRGIHLKKGDLIQVKVTPSDGKIEGETLLSPPVKIINSAPAIKEVRIEPKIAYASDDLKASVKSLDADGDSINHSYTWEKNGIILSQETTDILPRSRFKKGDSIAVTVIPNDGGAFVVPKKSEPVVIANSPPIITSSPPNKADGNIYAYQVKANDPDNDPIVYALKTGPKGMEIDKESGLIRWEIRKGDQGTQSIEIEASDGEGAKCFQRYTLAIEFK
jgi:hypothetical protein